MNLNDVIEFLNSRPLLGDNGRWEIERALNECPPADLASATRLLRSRVEEWVRSNFDALPAELITEREDFCEATYCFDEADYQTFVDDTCRDEFEKWCADNEFDPLDENSAEEYATTEADGDFLEWQESRRGIIWGTMFRTQWEAAARAMYNTGCVVIDGDDFGYGGYLIGFSGAGYSFYGGHWIPAYLEVHPEAREFFTVNGEFPNIRSL